MIDKRGNYSIPEDGNGIKSDSTAVGNKLTYGWVSAIAGAFILLFAGNFLYSFGVLLKPLNDYFGWSRAAISGVVSIRSIMSAIASPVAGIMGDRYGAKRIILIGIFLAGVSYLLTSRITNLWQLYLFLGVLTGIGMSAFVVQIVATVTRWFGGKSALANGIVLSGFGWAQVILPPVATYLILQYGWERCFIILGAVALVMGTVAWSFIKTRPKIRSEPLLEPMPRNAPEDIGIRPRVKEDYTLSEALHTPSLWILFLVLLIVAAACQMVVVHIVAAAIDLDITPEAAAIILTLNGVTNTLGRLTAGVLAVKIGNKTVLTLSLAVQSLILILLSRAGSLNSFYVLATIHGLAYGAVTPLVPSLAGDLFGTRAIGAIFGTTNAAYTAGAAIGPLLAGYIFDRTGGYSLAFISAAIGMAIALVLLLLIKPPHRGPK